MIGNEIRRQRNAQQLNLKAFSDITGLSVAHLSKIENGKVACPISTYIKITDALDISLKELMTADEVQDHLFTPAAETNSLPDESVGVHGYNFKPIGSEWPNRNFNAFVLTYHPDAAQDRLHFTSDVDEFLFAIEGEIEFYHGEDRFVLTPGDSLILNANIPHGGKAMNGKIARCVYLTLRRP